MKELRPFLTWMLLAAALFAMLKMPLVLCMIYALPLAFVPDLLLSLWKGMKSAVDGGKKGAENLASWVSSKGRFLLRLFVTGPAAALMGILYWRHTDWKPLWLCLLLFFGWYYFERLLDKLKKEEEETVTVVVRNPNEDFEITTIPKVTDSGDLWAASFDGEGRSLGLSRVVEKRGKWFASLADGTKHARLFYWDGNVNLTETPWADKPEAGIPENGKPAECDVDF